MASGTKYPSGNRKGLFVLLRKTIKGGLINDYIKSHRKRYRTRTY